MFPNLKAEMARKGFTVEKLALRSGINYHSLSQKLRGERKLTYAETLSIKEALGVDVPLEILFSQEAV